ncbi:MAG: PPOX class F420-dependent oxidoreductase [Anaerolineae bacterium]|nr:PPOX class F420-dependent oxidoreductase [Anaerolineae bacterium]
MTPVPIPDSHRDLLAAPCCPVLATVMPDGSPQTTPVWCVLDGDRIQINTMSAFRKAKNMRANPRVTLLALDPQNPQRHIEIRGIVVEMTEDGARAHLDALTQAYLRKPDAKFFGDSVPAALETRFTPVRVTIQPTRVRVEG